MARSTFISLSNLHGLIKNAYSRLGEVVHECMNVNADHQNRARTGRQHRFFLAFPAPIPDGFFGILSFLGGMLSLNVYIGYRH